MNHSNHLHLIWILHFQNKDTVSEEAEDEEDEEEELGQTDTYAEYVPSKCE